MHAQCDGCIIYTRGRPQLHNNTQDLVEFFCVCSDQALFLTLRWVGRVKGGRWTCVCTSVQMARFKLLLNNFIYHVYGKALQRLLALQNSSVCEFSLCRRLTFHWMGAYQTQTHLCSNDDCNVLDAPRVECFVRVCVYACVY